MEKSTDTRIPPAAHLTGRDVYLNDLRSLPVTLRVQIVMEEVSLDKAANFTRQDSILLNLQRACEASIDAGMAGFRNIAAHNYRELDIDVVET